MGILSRIGEITKANINDFLDKLEDPEKAVNQMIVESKENLASVKADVAKVNAQVTAIEREKSALEKEIKRITESAENAVKAGDDASALNILERVEEKKSKLSDVEKRLQTAKASSEKFTKMYNDTVDSIKVLEDKRRDIASTNQMAKAQENLNKINDKVDTSKTMSRLSDMEAKAQRRLDEASAAADLDAQFDAGDETDQAIAKYSQPSSSAQDALAEMKARMGLA